ncbi:unnamed protein product [Symbiodinium necroappetens]|uniref:Ubiquitin-like domain-containing protein n=1 Tax=Symbiodinium necroappetens TaxID=1628268 RepID=A0A812JIM4_9DINO|nr:unnamed protein product [Symbiodinium necroappetens]
MLRAVLIGLESSPDGNPMNVLTEEQVEELFFRWSWFAEKEKEEETPPLSDEKDEVITLHLLQPSGRSTSCRVSLRDRISDVKMRVKCALSMTSGYVRLIRDGEELLDIKSTVKEHGLSDGETITVVFNQSYTYASLRAGEKPPWEPVRAPPEMAAGLLPVSAPEETPAAANGFLSAGLHSCAGLLTAPRSGGGLALTLAAQPALDSTHRVLGPVLMGRRCFRRLEAMAPLSLEAHPRVPIFLQLPKSEAGFCACGGADLLWGFRGFKGLRGFRGPWCRVGALGGFWVEVLGLSGWKCQAESASSGVDHA